MDSDKVLLGAVSIAAIMTVVNVMWLTWRRHNIPDRSCLHRDVRKVHLAFVSRCFRDASLGGLFLSLLAAVYVAVHDRKSPIAMGRQLYSSPVDQIEIILFIAAATVATVTFAWLVIGPADSSTRTWIRSVSYLRSGHRTRPRKIEEVYEWLAYCSQMNVLKKGLQAAGNLPADATPSLAWQRILAHMSHSRALGVLSAEAERRSYDSERVFRSANEEATDASSAFEPTRADEFVKRASKHYAISAAILFLAILISTVSVEAVIRKITN